MIGLIEFEGIYFSPEKVNFVRKTSDRGVLLSFNAGYIRFEGTEKYEKIVKLINDALSRNRSNPHK